jgi:hypothetical protein
MANDVETEQEMSRRLAHQNLEHLAHLRNFASEQVASQARWLNASLLAVNSASLFAIFQLGSVQRSEEAIIAFVIGVGATLLSAVVLQENYMKNLPNSISAQRPYWTQVSISGERQPEEERSLSNSAKANSWVHFTAPFLGYVSGISWFVGALIFAFQLFPNTPAGGL